MKTERRVIVTPYGRTEIQIRRRERQFSIAGGAVLLVGIATLAYAWIAIITLFH